VKPAVLDEDRARFVAGDGAARDEQAGHVCLECLGVVVRPVPFVELDSRSSHEIGVGTIPGQQEDGVRRNLLDARRSSHDDRRRPDLSHAGVESRRD